MVSTSAAHPNSGDTFVETNSSAKEWPAIILKENPERDEFLVQWLGNDGDGKPWKDSWTPRSACSEGLLMAWKKNPNNPRNKAPASDGREVSRDRFSQSSSFRSRALSLEVRSHRKRRAAEAHLDPESERALINKKRRPSPAPPVDDLPYEPSQSIPPLLPRIQPVRAASPQKPRPDIAKRRIVSDNESDSHGSIPRGGGTSVASSGAHSAPSNKRMRARRSVATRHSSSKLSDGGSSQRHYSKDTAKSSTSGGESERSKRKPKVGLPGPVAKRSPAKVGPPIGRPRTAPIKASHKVGPPIGKPKSVAQTSFAPTQPQAGRSGNLTETELHPSLSTRSYHHLNSGDEDVYDDSTCPLQAGAPTTQWPKPRPTPRFKPKVPTAAPVRITSPYSTEEGTLAFPQTPPISKPETEHNSGGRNAVVPPSRALPSSHRSRAYEKSDEISAFTATATATASLAHPTASSPIVSGSLPTPRSPSIPASLPHPTNISESLTKATSGEHAEERPRSSGPIRTLTPSTFRKYQMPGSDDEIDEIDEIEDYQSDSVLPPGKRSHGASSSRADALEVKSEAAPLDIATGDTLETRDSGTAQTDPTPYSPTRFRVDSPPPSTADADISRLELRVPSSAETPSQAADAFSASNVAEADAKVQQSKYADNASAEAVDKPTSSRGSRSDGRPAHRTSLLQSPSHPSSRTRADDSGVVPETQESAPSTDPISLEPHVTRSSHLTRSQLDTENYPAFAVLTAGSALSLPPARQREHSAPFGSSPDASANAFDSRTNELSSTQSDPAVSIEIALLRRQLSDAENAIKSKDEELLNVQIEAARREREVVAIAREAESKKYKGFLNEQKKLYDQVIRGLKDRSGVKRISTEPVEGQDGEISWESADHAAFRAAVTQLCTFLSMLSTEASGIEGHASRAMASLNSIDNYATTATEAPLSSGPNSEVLSALVALTSSSPALRELRLSAIASEAETVVSRILALVKGLQRCAAESSNAYDALVRARDVANADVEYFRSECQVVSSRAAELGKENRNLATQNEIAMSAARDGVKQAELYFEKRKAALRRHLVEVETRANILTQRCERVAAKAHLIPVYRAEAARLYANLGLGDDDLEFPMIVDAALGKFRHLQQRWQEDFASVGDLLSIDAEKFDHVEDFAAELMTEVERLIRGSWTDLGELSQIGVQIEDANDLKSLVSDIIYRFKAMQDTVYQLRSEHRSTPGSQDIFTPNVATQYTNMGNNYHYESPGATHEQSTTAAEASELRPAARHRSTPALPRNVKDMVLATTEHNQTALQAGLSSSTGTLEPDDEIYPCPSKDRDDRLCAMVFKTFEDVKRHVLDMHVYPDPAA